MAGQCSARFGWSWTDVSVLGSQVFGQALMDSCGRLRNCRLQLAQPSHRPMEPPTSERKLARLISGKSVLVTSTLLEKVRRRVDKLRGPMLSEICFVSVFFVVQGSGQSESWVPSKRSP